MPTFAPGAPATIVVPEIATAAPSLAATFGVCAVSFAVWVSLVQPLPPSVNTNAAPWPDVAAAAEPWRAGDDRRALSATERPASHRPSVRNRQRGARPRAAAVGVHERGALIGLTVLGRGRGAGDEDVAILRDCEGDTELSPLAPAGSVSLVVWLVSADQPLPGSSYTSTAPAKLPPPIAPAAITEPLFETATEWPRPSPSFGPSRSAGRPASRSSTHSRSRANTNTIPSPLPPPVAPAAIVPPSPEIATEDPSFAPAPARLTSAPTSTRSRTSRSAPENTSTAPASASPPTVASGAPATTLRRRTRASTRLRHSSRPSASQAATYGSTCIGYAAPRVSLGSAAGSIEPSPDRQPPPAGVAHVQPAIGESRVSGRLNTTDCRSPASEARRSPDSASESVNTPPARIAGARAQRTPAPARAGRS